MIRVDGIEGRVAVVTGGARGIGRKTVEALKYNGAKVASLDVTAHGDASILEISCDVTDVESVNFAFDRIESELGIATILVLNAGIYRLATLEDTTLELWAGTLNVNLTGAFLCAKRALPRMREQRYGRVVGLGSSAGKTGGAKSAVAYAVSKAGLMTLIKAIATEYAPYGVTANALAPALIDTEMIAATREELVNKIPVGRLGKPEEVASLILYLCSSDAGYITGEVVDINGGFLID
jgi:NAD(P)-dependent dehydrogenase (short-subunit alcohol dehydrogenase family)